MTLRRKQNIQLAIVGGILLAIILMTVFAPWLAPYDPLEVRMEDQLLPPCLFLLACGLCTAVILQQGRRILTTVEEGEPFQRANAQALRRAAVCCWGICALALIRLVWELMGAGGLAPLFTYNALFVPIFFMAGLLFLVMSALFRQASELKEDQDLTI